MRVNYRLWSEQEDALIIGEYQKWPMKASGTMADGLNHFLAERLNRPVGSVNNHIHGLYKSGKLQQRFTQIPSLTMTEPEKAWVAGILDGEGSIHIAKLPSVRRGVRYHVRVSIVNTDHGVLDEAQRLVPLFSRNIAHAAGKLLANGYRSTKDCYVLCISNIPAAKAFLTVVRPYLRQTDKARLADEVLSLSGINGTY